MFPQLTPPHYFAHRGSSKYAPENTMAAFNLALEQGARAIEFDVKLTADRYVVIHHDATLDRTTTGSGPLAKQTLAALRQLDAGIKFSPAFRGEKIPTLDEVFAALGQKLFMNIELTNYTTPFDGLVGEVVKLIQKYGLEQRVMFSSFFPTNLFLARRLLPDVPRGQLAFEGNMGWWQRALWNLMNVQAVHPAKEDITAEMVKRAHARGRRVYVYTVNDAAEMDKLRSQGVDGIFSDDPLVAREHFQKIS